MAFLVTLGQYGFLTDNCLSLAILLSVACVNKNFNFELKLTLLPVWKLCGKPEFEWEWEGFIT